jgi:hypothetical protein
VQVTQLQLSNAVVWQPSEKLKSIFIASINNLSSTSKTAAGSAFRTTIFLPNNNHAIQISVQHDGQLVAALRCRSISSPLAAEEEYDSMSVQVFYYRFCDMMDGCPMRLVSDVTQALYRMSNHVSMVSLE